MENCKSVRLGGCKDYHRLARRRSPPVEDRKEGVQYRLRVMDRHTSIIVYSFYSSLHWGAMAIHCTRVTYFLKKLQFWNEG